MNSHRKKKKKKRERDKLKCGINKAISCEDLEIFLSVAKLHNDLHKNNFIVSCQDFLEV